MSLSIRHAQHNNAMPCAECRYAECSVSFTIMLSAIMLNVVMLSVVAQNEKLINKLFHLNGQPLFLKKRNRIHIFSKNNF